MFIVTHYLIDELLRLHTSENIP